MVKCTICGNENASEYYQIGGLSYCERHRHMAPRAEPAPKAKSAPAAVRPTMKKKIVKEPEPESEPMPLKIPQREQVVLPSGGFLKSVTNFLGFGEDNDNKGETMPKGKPKREVEEDTEDAPEQEEAPIETELAPKTVERTAPRPRSPVRPPLPRLPARQAPTRPAPRPRPHPEEPTEPVEEPMPMPTPPMPAPPGINARMRMQQDAELKRQQAEAQTKQWQTFYDTVLSRLPLTAVGNIVLVPNYQNCNLLVIYDKLNRPISVLQVDFLDLNRLKQTLNTVLP